MGEVSGFAGEVSGTIFCCSRNLHVPFTEKLWSENAWLAGFVNKLGICNDPTANSCGITAFSQQLDELLHILPASYGHITGKTLKIVMPER